MYETIRRDAKIFAQFLNAVAPECPEKELALVRLQEAVMWANAAVARHD